MRTLMKVLNNLFGNNTKINANAIAFKDSNNDTYNLDDYLKSGNVYSTSEKKIGTWIDGKPIYRKVITGTTPSNNSQITTINNGQEIINLYGFINSWSSNRIPINSYNNANDYCRVFGDTTSPIKITITCSSSYYNMPYKIIVEYTKTTD